MTLESAFARARREGRRALMPFLMAGFPSMEGFREQLRTAAEFADVIEVGVPVRPEGLRGGAGGVTAALPWAHRWRRRIPAPDTVIDFLLIAIRGGTRFLAFGG